MLALLQFVAFAVAFAGMTHTSLNVFAQNATCASNYTVKSGDICQTIASQFNVTIDALEEANPSINSGCTNLAVGEVLCVPAAVGCANSTATYVVKDGDACVAIASQFNVTTEALEAANPQINAACTNLDIGETLCIP